MGLGRTRARAVSPNHDTRVADSAKKIIMEIDNLEFNESEPYVQILGIVAEKSLNKLRRGLVSTQKPNPYLHYFFATRSEFDIELNHEFEIIWQLENPFIYQKAKISLFEICSNMNFPLSVLSKGWRTVVCFEINVECSLCEKIPIIETWAEGDFDKSYVVSSEKCWSTSKVSKTKI